MMLIIIMIMEYDDDQIDADDFKMIVMMLIA